MNNLMSSSESHLQEALATTLLANLAAFQAFARQRLHDDQLAADAVQESLLHALRAGPQLEHDENLVAWFYRILRNVLTDLHRRRATQTVALEKFAQELETTSQPDRALETVACQCLRSLLPTLRPAYAQMIELADLEDQPQEAIARTLDLSRSNVKVRLLRARRQLRERLEQTCQACATHGCLDCTCEGVPHEE